MEDGRERLSWLPRGMRTQFAGKKAASGRCGMAIEPRGVLGHTRSIEVCVGAAQSEPDGTKHAMRLWMPIRERQLDGIIRQRAHDTSRPRTCRFRRCHRRRPQPHHLQGTAEQVRTGRLPRRCVQSRSRASGRSPWAARICTARSLKPSDSPVAASTIRRSCMSRMLSLSKIAVPKLSAIQSACASSGACQADHFDGSALAELDDSGGLAGLGCGLCHDGFLLGLPEAVRPLGRSALRCGRDEPAQGGRFKAREARSSGAGARASGSLRPARPAFLLCDKRHDRPPRGATAALKRPTAGSD